MPRVRETLDGDLTVNFAQTSPFKTERHRFEINCDKCNVVFYSDPETFEQIKRAMELGADNPFLCDDCQEELEETAHPNH